MYWDYLTYTLWPTRANTIIIQSLPIMPSWLWLPFPSLSLSLSLSLPLYFSFSFMVVSPITKGGTEVDDDDADL